MLNLWVTDNIMHPHYKEHSILLCTEVAIVSSENHKEYVSTKNGQKENYCKSM